MKNLDFKVSKSKSDVNAAYHLPTREHDMALLHK